MEDLARQLWTGPLPDPSAPGRDLAGVADYQTALSRARALVGWSLPVDLAALRARWPWSIDLARLSVEAEGDLAPLHAAVTTAGRRLGVLARALWSQGRVDEALACLDTLDPASETFAEDHATRAELRILSDLPADPVPGPRGVHLSLLSLWREEGAEALARRLTRDAADLPAHAPLWAWLIDTFITERDFARAREALGGFAARLPAHPDLAAARIRLALEAEDRTSARALLDAQGEADAPWRWTARRYVQHLRWLTDDISAADQPDFTPLRLQAEAALRLHPRNGILQGLWLMARELTEDWDALARDLADWPDARAAAALLLRLGLPDAALSALDRAAPAPPDEAFRTRLRRAEALLRKGALAEAGAALGPCPRAAPLAADHAYWSAEIAAAARDLPAARAALSPSLASSPARMGLWLSAARVAFLSGDDASAAEALTRFRALKTAQLGAPPPDDLRDLIARDAATGQPGPGLAARAFARALPAFQPQEGPPIPPRIAHYWEGPRSAPLERSLRAWAGLYPQTLYDAASARAWLATNTDLAPLFDRLTQPATRADLFRVALIARDGGLFADLDEYPRAPLDDWLQSAAAVLVVEEGHATIANNFLAARPGLPLFTRLQDRIAATLNATEQPYPWWHSGPAPLTVEAHDARATPGLRVLPQPAYEARIATNLPFPHKRGPGHWR
ncbi:glycosyltransferase [Pararhodobacter sp.]|uniref:glycosyltransferase n=1 Tax=Pararhodobacter sp. TaxID=2127056 RepID=UPI002AFE2AC4|nr:glycosyltransferase [Pararhodobacter sp.]